MNELPTGLYALFEFLRKAGVPLGVDDYMLAVRALRAGKGLEDLDELKFACGLFWAKSKEDLALFEAAFERLMAPRLKPAEPVREFDESPVESRRETRMPDKEQPPRIERDFIERDEEAPILEAADEAEEFLEGQAPLLRDPDAGGDAYRARGVYEFIPRSPIGRREVSSIWRHLRVMKRAGPLVELDVDETIGRTGRTGYYLGPVLRPSRQNQVRLTVLVDRSPLMAPFAPLVDTLIEGIRRSGLAGPIAVWYFDSAPAGSLAKNPNLTDYRSIDDVLSGSGSAVLIVGEAGAAQGVYRSRDDEAICTFLKRLRRHTYLYAWLNPFPADRWRGATAEAAARRVTMYPMDRDGMVDAVNILRGHPTPPGVHLDG